ncbi:MAG: ribulose-phosphate 3-epimerase [Caldiserica bacterium]|nr:MAG: ribulose-phosphate 3-epimerase [Caldisericota bacterium]
MSKVAVSILDADILNLREEIEKVKDADLIHLDIMDGHFVKNLSFGANVCKRINEEFDFYIESHLMVYEPEKFWNDFFLAGSKRIIFHIEATKNPLKLIKTLKKNKTSVGLSLNPETDVKKILKYIKDIDLVLVMSVNPGRGGQRFIDDVLKKVSYLDELRNKYGYRFLLEIDGGINYYTGRKAVKRGIDILVSGSYIFKKGDAKRNLQLLKSIKR